jgi:hypothetical protein
MFGLLFLRGGWEIFLRCRGAGMRSRGVFAILRNEDGGDTIAGIDDAGQIIRADLRNQVFAAHGAGMRKIDGDDIVLADR